MLPGRGNNEIGPRSSGPIIFDTLGSGTTVANFHDLGKAKLSKIVSTSSNSKLDSCKNNNFHILDAISGRPLDLHTFIFLIHFKITSVIRLLSGSVDGCLP